MMRALVEPAGFDGPQSSAPTGKAVWYRWAIITVEYPPQLGGVADYTHAVAAGLASLGDDVHVWAPEHDGAPPADPGVSLHRVRGRFGPLALLKLSRELHDLPTPYRLLVQYVPQGFGARGMNVLFALWLRSRRDRSLWLMFHEVALAPHEATRPDRWLQAHITRLMARVSCRAADRVFVSIPAWASLLTSLTGGSQSAEWLPIPSNVPRIASPSRVRQLRVMFTPGDEVLLGHFGVTRHRGGRDLGEAFARLLESDCARIALLVGRHSEALGAWITRTYPELRSRVYSVGTLPLPEVAAHLAACDVLVQPYADGVSTRRTTTMAGLALGVPIVTVDGHRTEDLWRQSGAVALASDDSASALAATVEMLLAQPAERTRLGRAGRELYERRFALTHTLDALRGDYRRT